MAGPSFLERAEAALAAGRVTDAISFLGQAAAQASSPAPLLHDRGYLELASGAIEAAAASFRAAVAADPDFALAHFRLGVALEALDDAQGALAAFRQARGPANLRPEALYREGALLDRLGRVDEARDAFQAAAASTPATAPSRLAAARLLLDASDADGAGRVLRELLSAQPGHAEATDLLGTVLAEQGLAAEAWEAHAAAIARSPLYAGSFYDMALTRRITPAAAPIIARLEALAQNGIVRGEALTRLHLGLGRAADDMGDAAHAMRHFDAACSLRDRGMAEPARRLVAHAARMRATFATPLATDGPDRHDAPILVCGLPRSGTTLVEQILSSHTAIRAGGELAFWSTHAPLDCAGLPVRDELDALARGYRAVLGAIGGEKARVTDKAPLNVLHAGLIHLAVPDARIIVCRRRPIDVALSIHRTWFNRMAGFPTGGEALVAVIHAVEALADHWRNILPGTRYFELRYDHLVAAPDATIRDLLTFCGIPFEEGCLAPERNDRTVRTPSKWQVRRRITPPDPEAWRRFEGMLGSLAALVPKDPTGHDPSPATSA